MGKHIGREERAYCATGRVSEKENTVWAFARGVNDGGAEAGSYLGEAADCDMPWEAWPKERVSRHVRRETNGNVDLRLGHWACKNKGAKMSSHLYGRTTL